MWNSRGGWKKYQKLIVGGGGWKKLKILIAVGELAFKLLFSTALRKFVYTVKVK